MFFGAWGFRHFKALGSLECQGIIFQGQRKAIEAFEALTTGA